MRVALIAYMEQEETNNLKRQVRSRDGVIVIAALTAVLSLTAYANSTPANNAPSGASDQDVKNLGSSAATDRKTAEEHIQKAGPGAIPNLINGLDDSNQTIRARAAWLLRQITYQFKSLPNDLVAGQIARRIHTEKDMKTREEMIKALREYAGPTAIRELKRSAAEDSDWLIRLESTHFVADAAVDPSKELPFFRKQAKDANNAIKLAAFYELARLGDTSGRGIAVQILNKSTDWFEKTEAMQVVGAAGNPADLPLLKNIIDSKDTGGELRLRAILAYKNNQLLQLSGNDQLDFLINALDDSSPGVPFWAYTRLWKFPDSNTSARLKKYLNEKGHRSYNEAANALKLR